MQSSERHRKILELVKVQGTVSVEQLSSEFDISVQTIRADLRDLDRARKLIRFHGGARTVDGRENLEYESRRQIAASEKVAIGKAAAALIPNNASLFVNIGTTT